MSGGAMMDCPDRARLWAFAAGRLEAGAASSVDEHLRACAECRSEVTAMRATREVLDAHEPAGAPESARDLDAPPLPAPEAAPSSARGVPGLFVVVGLGGVALVVALSALLGSSSREASGASASAVADAGRSGAIVPVERVAMPVPAVVEQRVEARAACPPDGEDYFLRRAQEEAGAEACVRFLAGLAEYEGAPQAAAREKARVLRARCFVRQRQGAEADAEYRRYLKEFPEGRWVEEARRFVAH